MSNGTVMKSSLTKVALLLLAACYATAVFDGPPLGAVPPGDFDGVDCCPDDFSCCCGLCLPPSGCAAITCVVPDFVPDDYQPCCDPSESPEPAPAPDLAPEPSDDGDEPCCPEGTVCCCNSFCIELALCSCLTPLPPVPDGFEPCCDAPPPVDFEEPEPPIDDGCSVEAPLCICGHCYSYEDTAHKSLRYCDRGCA